MTAHVDVPMPDETETQPTAQEQVMGGGLLIHQIKESIAAGSDPRSAFRQALTILAHQLLQASSSQTMVRQLASDLQQNAEDLAGLCVGQDSKTS
jgi:hypothetical protein